MKSSFVWVVVDGGGGGSRGAYLAHGLYRRYCYIIFNDFEMLGTFLPGHFQYIYVFIQEHIYYRVDS